MALQCDDLDAETSALIARMALEDIEELYNSRKGKGRYDAPLTDAEVALQMQAENLRTFLKLIDDSQVAQSLATENAGSTACSSEDTTPRWVLQNNFDYVSECIGTVLKINRLGVHARRSNTLFKTTFFHSSTIFRLQCQCTVCLNTYPTSSGFCAPCDHYYCEDCLMDLVYATTRDESLFPPKCCKQNFPTQDILTCLKQDQELLSLFQTKSIEFGTPSNRRIYCPTPKCSTFLSVMGESSGGVPCPHCHIIVCTSCKNTAHPGEDCTVAASTLKLKELARSKGWKTCPGCSGVVELSLGCFHVICRCKAGFYYRCTVRWKCCSCPLWEERFLLHNDG